MTLQCVKFLASKLVLNCSASKLVFELFCQTQANFSVTELTAHLTSSCLSHIEPMIWMQFQLNKTVYKPFFTHTFSFSPSLLPCKENPAVHPTLFSPSYFFPSKFRSFPFILSRCQGHPLGYLVSASFLPQVCVTSYCDFCPVCLSGPCYGHMPNAIAQAVFLICRCKLWFHYFAQLTSALLWLL